jgi:DNA-binding transcriptional regulator PaaX
MVSKFKGIKTAAEYRRGEIARDILRLVGTGVVLGTAVVAPNVVQVLDMFDPKGREQRNKIWKAIKYLEQQERIRIAEEKGTRVLVLTKRGKTVLNELSIEELAVQPPRMWDRRWRVVMFDIPMYKSRTRIPFREKIQDLGFEMYQKSVWVYPYECREEVLMVAEHYGVREYIRYMVVDEMSNMREFVKKFDLL